MRHRKVEKQVLRCGAHNGDPDAGPVRRPHPGGVAEMEFSFFLVLCGHHRTDKKARRGKTKEKEETGTEEGKSETQTKGRGEGG